MATNHQSLRRNCSKPMLVWARSLQAAGALSLLVVLLSGCTREPEPQSPQFVGAWKSSRLDSRPLHLLANGDWEIRAEDGGRPLQFGVWQVQSRTMLWTFRTNGQTIHDKNRIESFALNQFVLREQDGSLTSFKRLD